MTSAKENVFIPILSNTRKDRRILQNILECNVSLL